MIISLDDRFAPLIESLIKSGRYASAEDIVRHGILLLQAEDAKLQALRDEINASIEAGGQYTDDEISAYLDDDTNEIDLTDEAKLEALRAMINASIEAGGENTVEDVKRALKELDEELRLEGY